MQFELFFLSWVSSVQVQPVMCHKFSLCCIKKLLEFVVCEASERLAVVFLAVTGVWDKRKTKPEKKLLLSITAHTFSVPHSFKIFPCFFWVSARLFTEHVLRHVQGRKQLWFWLLRKPGESMGCAVCVCVCSGSDVTHSMTLNRRQWKAKRWGASSDTIMFYVRLILFKPRKPVKENIWRENPDSEYCLYVTITYRT